MTAPYRIEVAPVDLPAQVDTPQVVVRTGAGEMAPVETRRWISPLRDEIRNALSAELSGRLGAQDVYGLDGDAARAGVETYRVDLKVSRFESALGAYARIDAAWTVRRAGAGTPAVVCNGSYNEAVDPGYAALAQGYQRALARLAQSIAADVEGQRSTPPATACSTAGVVPGRGGG
jgi:uncharacterized lipoprotein YmbA